MLCTRRAIDDGAGDESVATADIENPLHPTEIQSGQRCLGDGALQIANGIGAGEPTIDNFTLVPEPSTWLAAGLSLLAIAYSRRRLGKTLAR